MVSKYLLRFAALLALCAYVNANAAVILSADLTTANEATEPGLQDTPPDTGEALTAGAGAPDPNAPRPTSFGNATFFLNDAMTALTMTATIFNIDVTGAQTDGENDDLVAAHIHASPTVSQVPPISTAPVVWGFFGSPFSDTNPQNVFLTPFSSGVGGVFQGTWDAPEGNSTTLAAQLNNILSGQSYLNFHTVQFRAGEIRGPLQVQQVLPEPDSLALLMIALGSLGVALRRR